MAIIHESGFAQEEAGQSLLFCRLAYRLAARSSCAPPLENSGLVAKAIVLVASGRMAEKLPRVLLQQHECHHAPEVG